MSYRDLLVHLNDSTGCAKRVDLAIGLAAEHGAHLTGLYPIVEIPVSSYIETQIPPDVRAGMDAEAKARAEVALAAFRAAAERSGIAHAACTDRALDTTLSAVVGLHARYADLIVLGQVDPSEPPPVGRHLPENVLLSSGRAALVVPYIGAQAMLGRRVLVAWDASREAARAVSEAMPILERAEVVHVVTFNPRPTALGHGEVPGADIARHLARHKVEVEVKPVRTDRIQVGEALLSFAAEGAYDLLVMGAYAHSRVRELILGGTTRTVLESMTLPVLMAH